MLQLLVISYLGDPCKNPSLIIFKNVQFHCLFISFLHQNWIKHDDILAWPPVKLMLLFLHIQKLD